MTRAKLVMELPKMDRFWVLQTMNALSGLMNTIQNPVSEVLVTLLSPKEQVQRVSGLLSLS